MSRADQAFARLVAANPWPETTELPDGLDVLSPRIEEETMAVHELERKKEEQRRWGVPAVAVAAFIIVLGVGIALAITVSRSEVEPAGTETAAAYFEARNSWDGEAAQALFRPGARIEDDLASVVSDYARVAEFDRANGNTMILDECTQTNVGVVRCTYALENDFSRALGIDVPSSGNSYTFRIVDGEIIHLEARVSEIFLGQVLGPFIDWLEQTHPEDIPQMYAVGPREPWPRNKPRLDPVSVALWERYTDEFVEFVESSG